MLEIIYNFLNFVNNSPWPFVIGISIFCIMLLNEMALIYGVTNTKQKFRYIILMFCLFILFFIYINYVSNLIVYDHPLLTVGKDFKDCDCYKYLNHGDEKLPLNLVFTYENNSLICKFILLDCNCNCDYCLKFNKFVYSFHVFYPIVKIGYYIWKYLGSK